MDSFIKQGKELYESGKITNEDIKDAGAAFAKDGDLASRAKEAYSEYQNNHKDDAKKAESSKKEDAPKKD
ncbi:hypothetical protein Cantr_04184 [Candida viswanathii]|uniref:Antitoxin n=1 Tax=Candida viswanathii TaxID=5486 RepID=A0A367XNM1_9ASCO|nr:hypothetical protein Cantr_04184 [Candida viswanathii]